VKSMAVVNIHIKGIWTEEKDIILTFHIIITRCQPSAINGGGLVLDAEVHLGGETHPTSVNCSQLTHNNSSSKPHLSVFFSSSIRWRQTTAVLKSICTVRSTGFVPAVRLPQCPIYLYLSYHHSPDAISRSSSIASSSLLHHVLKMSAPEKQKISLKRIAHVYYTHRDLEAAHKFLLDFGFSVVTKTDSQIYYRGYGTEPFVYCATKGEEDAFGGTGWVVDSLEDLELATKLPNATPIHDSDTPGGGKRVTFYDEIDKFPFHLVYGQSSVEIAETFPELAYNFPTVKHRPVNQTQRFKKGPAPVHKLGHYGVCVTNYKKAWEFWNANFNFKASEIVYDPKTGDEVMTFMHIDRGEELVDHHAFFFFEGPKFHVHHSSFEVFDFDVQMLGHTWLKDKGYENCWGVGRHVMGSQIFDYW